MNIKSESKIYFCIFPFTIFFIIGICCILLGCNTDLKGQCISYNVVFGTVYKHEVDQHTCQLCVSRDVNGDCDIYNYYPCYNSYLKYHYNNQSCTLEVHSDDRSEQSAYNYLDNFPIGYSRYLLKNKNSKECLKTGVGLNTWITGVSFLSLSALVLLIFLITILYKYILQIVSLNSNWEKFSDYDPDL